LQALADRRSTQLPVGRELVVILGAVWVQPRSLAPGRLVLLWVFTVGARGWFVVVVEEVSFHVCAGAIAGWGTRTERPVKDGTADGQPGGRLAVCGSTGRACAGVGVGYWKLWVGLIGPQHPQTLRTQRAIR
jgi:hypothetical protein